MLPPNPKYRRVIFTQAELISFGDAVEKKVVARLREHGIPVKGLFHFNGVKTGVIRAKSRPADGSRVIEWFDSVNTAKDHGVDFGENAEAQFEQVGGSLK